jgi:hypothetical protein
LDNYLKKNKSATVQGLNENDGCENQCMAMQAMLTLELAAILTLTF